jgi:hypothetical protein
MTTGKEPRLWSWDTEPGNGWDESRLAVRGVDMAISYNGMKMTDGTDYRVLMKFPELVSAIDSALKAGGLLTLPMGISRPGMPVTINPQHVVSLTDYSDA